MIDFILQYKWVFFIIGEVVFWGSLAGFFLLRYLFGLDKISKYMIILWLMSDIWLLTIGILDYTRTGVFDTFQLIIVVALLYALTFGRSDMKKLDRWIKRKVKHWKGEPLEAEDVDHKKYGAELAIHEGKQFALHLALYIVIMGGFAIFLDMRPFHEWFTAGNLGDTISNLIANGLFYDPTMSKISGIWTLILIIDAIITVSYVIFPKKPA